MQFYHFSIFIKKSETAWKQNLTIWNCLKTKPNYLKLLKKLHYLKLFKKKNLRHYITKQSIKLRKNIITNTINNSILTHLWCSQKTPYDACLYSHSTPLFSASPLSRSRPLQLFHASLMQVSPRPLDRFLDVMIVDSHVPRTTFKTDGLFWLHVEDRVRFTRWAFGLVWGLLKLLVVLLLSLRNQGFLHVGFARLILVILSLILLNHLKLLHWRIAHLYRLVVHPISLVYYLVVFLLI